MSEWIRGADGVVRQRPRQAVWRRGGATSPKRQEILQAKKPIKITFKGKVFSSDSCHFDLIRFMHQVNVLRLSVLRCELMFSWRRHHSRNWDKRRSRSRSGERRSRSRDKKRRARSRSNSRSKHRHRSRSRSKSRWTTILCLGFFSWMKMLICA